MLGFVTTVHQHYSANGVRWLPRRQRGCHANTAGSWLGVSGWAPGSKPTGRCPYDSSMRRRSFRSQQISQQTDQNEVARQRRNCKTPLDQVHGSSPKAHIAKQFGDDSVDARWANPGAPPFSTRECDPTSGCTVNEEGPLVAGLVTASGVVGRAADASRGASERAVDTLQPKAKR